jgi:hypothetical protein
MNKHQAIRAATEQIRTKQEKNNWFILKWDNTKKEFEKIQIIDKRASVWLAGYLRVELAMKLLGFPPADISSIALRYSNHEEYGRMWTQYIP